MLEDATRTLIPVYSDTRLVQWMEPIWETDVIKNEPMFFSADLDFVWRNGGPITQAFLQKVPGEYGAGKSIIDTRVHMLMPNFWPCIPGWHHDDVPRERSDGQPEYFNPSYRTKHCTAIVGDNPGNANTEFAIGDRSFPDVPVGKKYYKEWDPLVTQAVREMALFVRPLEYGEIVQFDDRAWHRGTRAHRFGWRWFARITRGSQRPITNEIRNQVQVYVSDPIEGW